MPPLARFFWIAPHIWRLRWPHWPITGRVMGLTRRALLEQIGRAGGLGAAYMAMETLGLAIATPACAENFEMPVKAAMAAR